CRNIVSEFHRQTNVTQINQVKAHHQQVIDRVSQGLIAVKNVHQKDATVFVQRVRDPDGQRDGNTEIEQVSHDCDVHFWPPSVKLNTFNSCSLRPVVLGCQALF